MPKNLTIRVLCGIIGLVLEGGCIMATFGKIGARGMLLNWHNPYIVDGLVAMWDGEWNVDPGIHDQNAKTWTDISGHGIDMTIIDGTFSSRGLAVTRSPNAAVVGAKIDSFENAAWFQEDGPFTLEMALDVSSITSSAGWGQNLLYADPRVVVCRVHQQSWQFTCKCYIGANREPNVRISTTVTAYPNPLTIALPFSTADNWNDRFSFRSHIRFDSLTPASFSSTTPVAMTDANVCKLVSGSALTVYIKRIAFYRGIDDNRSLYNHQIDKIRFNLT